MTLRSPDDVDRGRRAFLLGRFLRRGDDGARDSPAAALGPAPPCLPAATARQAACAGCAAPCVEVCEPEVIRLHPTGHSLAGTPYLTFRDAGCTFCGDCVERCPAVSEDRAARPRIGTARIDRAACVAWEGVVCMSCQLACADRAVVMDARQRPTIAGHACTGCGLCAPVCPPRAISIEFPPDPPSAATD